MNETYKYWIYYMKYDDNDDYDIYAYTDSKEISTIFESIRDMKKIKRKVVDLRKDEVNLLAYNYQSNILTLTEFSVTDDYKYLIAVTNQEKNVVESSLLTYEVKLSATCWTTPEIYNDKIYDALCVLGYKNFHDVIDGKTLIDGLRNSEFTLFIKFYGDTLKYLDRKGNV